MAASKRRLGEAREFWLSDCSASLQKLLRASQAFVEAFRCFLAAENNDEELQFVLEAQSLKTLDEPKALELASQLYDVYLAEIGDGIGQQDRTRATSRLWVQARREHAHSRDSDTRRRRLQVEQEAESVLKSLAFDAFPRFLRSKAYTQLHASWQATAGTNALVHLPESFNSMLPHTADDWLDWFISFAETWPASIVVSDMTVAGAPMVYVNSDFSAVTQYSRAEAVGRNCRFLQGSGTEPEAIEVIQRTLRKGEDCQVLLTNYRKNGETFRNLLSMRPIFDADGLYRYTVGVQLEVDIDRDPRLSSKLAMGQRFLRLMPRRLGLKSHGIAKDRGMLAPIVAAAPDKDTTTTNLSIEPAVESEAEDNDNREIEWKDTIFALTRISWLRRGRGLVKDLILGCPGALDIVREFVRVRCHRLMQQHLSIVVDASTALQNNADDLQLRRILARVNATRLGSGVIAAEACSTARLCERLEGGLELSCDFLAKQLLPRLMRSKAGPALVDSARKCELDRKMPGNSNARTCAYGIKPCEPSLYWLALFKSVAAEFDRIGIVVCDMRVPAIPLTFVNDGFKYITGFDGREQIGKTCSSVLQGSATEGYLVREICEALRDAQPLVLKLTNYAKSGLPFRCLLTLHPVFGSEGEYLFQIGTQLSMSAPPSEVYEHIQDCEDLLQMLPSHILCSNESDIRRNLVPRQHDEDEMANEELTKLTPQYQGLAETFAMTKLKWLLTPGKTVDALLQDPLGLDALARCAESAGSVLARCAVDFCELAAQVCSTSGTKQRQLIRRLSLRMKANTLFYCTSTDIAIGEIDSVDWSLVIDNVAKWRQIWADFLSSRFLKLLLNSSVGVHLFQELRERERTGTGATTTLSTVGQNSVAIDDQLWLSMAQEVATYLVGVSLSVFDLRESPAQLKETRNEHSLVTVLSACGQRDSACQPCFEVHARLDEPMGESELVSRLQIVDEVCRFLPTVVSGTLLEKRGEIRGKTPASATAEQKYAKMPEHSARPAFLAGPAPAGQASFDDLMAYKRSVSMLHTQSRWTIGSDLASAASGLQCEQQVQSGASPRPPSQDSARRPNAGRSPRLRTAGTRPKSALVPRPKQIAKMVEDPRIEELMAKHSTEDMRHILISDNETASRMKRALGSMLEEELSAYRSVFEDGAGAMGSSPACMQRDRSQLGKASDLKVLRNERALFQRLGFIEHVYALDEKIKTTEKMERSRTAEKVQNEMNRRLRFLRAQQKKRICTLQEELDEQIACARRQHKLNEEKLAEQHHEQRRLFLEQTLRRATGEEAASTQCTCTNPFLCRHNKTASYRLRKMNPLVVKYRAAAERLRSNHREAEANDYEAKANDIDNSERISWTKRIEETAAHRGDRLIEAQKASVADMQARNEALIHSMKERAAEKIKTLEKVLQCELEKTEHRMKQCIVNVRKGKMTTSALDHDRIESKGSWDPRVTISDNIRQELGELGGVLDFSGAHPSQLSSAGSAPPPPQKKAAADADPCSALCNFVKYRPWEQPTVAGCDNSAPLLLV